MSIYNSFSLVQLPIPTSTLESCICVMSILVLKLISQLTSATNQQTMLFDIVYVQVAGFALPHYSVLI